MACMGCVCVKLFEFLHLVRLVKKLQKTQSFVF